MRKTNNDFTIADHYNVRQVGLPSKTINSLGNFELSVICDKINYEIKTSSELRKLLCDKIYSLIKEENNPIKVRFFLDLKRAIHNNRKFEFKDLDIYLADDFVNLLNKWKIYLCNINELNTQGEEIANNFYYESLPKFISIFNMKNVQNAICHAQPYLYKRLFSLSTSTTLTSIERKALLSGLGYIYRMCTKTSPFSHFTVTGLNSFKYKTTKWKSNLAVAETNVFNIKILHIFLNHILLASNISKELTLLWNPTAIIIRNNVFVISRDLKNEHLSDQVENIASFPSNSFIELIKNVFLQAKRPINENNLVKILSKLVEERDVARLPSLVSKLITLNVLIPTLNYDENSLYGLYAFSKSKYFKKLPILIINSVKSLVERIGALKNFSGPEKCKTIFELTSITETILQHYKIDTIVKPEKIIHNTVYFKNPPIINKKLIESFLPDLKLISSSLAMFNMDYSIKEWINLKFHEFLNLYNCEPNIIEFFYFLNDGKIDEKNPLMNLEALLQFDFSKDQMKQQWNFISDLKVLLLEDSPEIIIEEKFWIKWQEKAKAFYNMSLPTSFCISGQFDFNSDVTQNRYILNKVFPGYGTMFTEPKLSFRKAKSDNLLSNQFSKFGKENVFVDIINIMGFQGQIRPEISKSHIYYPGQHVVYHPNKFFDWKNLYLRFDQRFNVTIFDVSTNKRIVPLHRGTLANIYFPVFYKYLLALGHNFSPDFSIFERILLNDDTENSKIIFYPRIRTGNIVLTRRAWSIPKHHLPKKLENYSSFFYYKMLRSWAVQIGLPKEGYTRLYQRIDSMSNLKKQRPNFKPFYLNFDDYTSINLFLKYVNTEIFDKIIFIEALPAVHSENISTNKYVSEYQFEVYQTSEL